MKDKMGPLNCLYPMPVVLVGAHVNGKPNYITMAHVGIMNHHTISLGMNKIHYTNAGIKENKTFSLNIPSAQMVKEADYCGIVSGKDADKAALFKTFYGTLGTAPMIAECAINLECRLVQTVDFPQHDIFLGEIVETYCEQSLLNDGKVDFARVQPILFVMNDRSYWKLGERLAKAWEIGKSFKSA